jgi:hypothetical protein
MSPLKNFLSDSQTTEPIELVRRYMSICDDLLFGEEMEVRDVIRLMTENIRRFARRNSNFYGGMDKIGIVDKSMLSDKENWYVPGIEYLEMFTQGTTSGKRFAYRAWAEAFWKVEREFHYRAVLKEFGIDKPKIVCLLGQHVHPSSRNDGFVVLKNPSSPLHSHGAEECEVHTIRTEIREDPSHQFQLLLKYLEEQRFDVMLTSGPFVNSLTHHIRKSGFRGKLCRLLSNTCEPLSRRDTLWMKGEGLIDNWCDHMRCWDGGASFLTCKAERYHLMDNLSYCRSEGGKLVSTDYFSLACPFVNYWNGDQVRIENNYNRCECGRLYRDFSFVSARDFSSFGLTSSMIRSRIVATGVRGIKAVNVGARATEIITSREFDWNERLSIQSSFPEISTVLFVVENDLNL